MKLNDTLLEFNDRLIEYLQKKIERETHRIKEYPPENKVQAAHCKMVLQNILNDVENDRI